MSISINKNMHSCINIIAKICTLSALLLLVSACSEDKEEIAFRASLIDKALNDDNSKTGAAFLKANAIRENVITTESGLQYKILSTDKKSVGIEQLSPKYLDFVEVDYEGRLVTGEIFDSSYKRNKSSIFPVKAVIKGWREVLLKMKAGDHWEVFVPANLAYGATSPSELIAANSTLIFEIKLKKIIPEAQHKKELDIGDKSE